MRIVLRRALFVVCLMAVLPLSTGYAEEKAPNFVQDAVSKIVLGPPSQGDVGILIPLLLPGKHPTGPAASQFGTNLSFAEPDFPSHRHAVNVTNNSDKPVLVLGGTVLVGGRRDRMIRHETVIGAGQTAELRALPAASTDEIRREPTSFQMAKSLGPVYLRRRADFGGNNGVVTSFIARNLEFRNEGDKEKSLAAIGRSSILESHTVSVRSRCASCMKAAEQHGTVVGAITAIRGRLQSLVLYGSADLLKRNTDAYLRGATYAAAALALQAKKKNIPMPGDNDADATLEIVKKEAAELLERLRKARFKKDRTLPEGAAGERLLLQVAGGARGRAVGVNGKLVHLSLYPHDPFESALYGSRIEIPDDTITNDPDRAGLAELGRQRRTGRRLSEAERRILRRLGGAARPRIGSGGIGGGGLRR